jgi:lipoate synthase
MAIYSSNRKILFCYLAIAKTQKLLSRECLKLTKSLYLLKINYEVFTASEFKNL